MCVSIAGTLGVAASIVLPSRFSASRYVPEPNECPNCSLHSAFGAAYGTAKSGQGIAAIAPRRPNMIMKSIVHAVMAGVIAIYGLVVAVLLAQKIERAPAYDLAR